MTNTTRSLAACAVAAIAVPAATADTTLSTYNFDSFNAGALTATADGLTAGQGGWYAYTATTASVPAANFNIVSDPAVGGTRGNALAIQGGDTRVGNNVERTAWTGDIRGAIGSRPAGEDLLVATFDMYVGGSATSKNRVGAYLYDSTGTKVLSGLFLQGNLRQLYSNVWSTSGSTTANTAASLGATAVLNLNQWYTFKLTYDMVSGVAQVGYLNAGTGLWNMYTVNGAAAGTTVDRLTLSSLPNMSSNSNGTSIGYYDNISVIATPAPGALALLGVAGLAGGRRRMRRG